MGNKERLKGILGRQAAAAERERLDEEAASTKAEKVRSVRVEVIQKWQEQRTQLETYIAQINKETSKNGVQLFVVKNPGHAHTGVSMEVDKMEVAFRQRTPNDKKLVISVKANGEANVSISTSSVSQAQQYTLNVLEVTNEQLEATVLDFLDANTPK
jgi:L-lactate utilization protein LutB